MRASRISRPDGDLAWVYVRKGDDGMDYAGIVLQVIAALILAYWRYGTTRSVLNKPLIFLRPGAARRILYLGLCLGFIGFLLWAEGTKPH